ncbi:hypothetical protein NMG60_11025757 [Bertholletia excelsa]
MNSLSITGSRSSLCLLLSVSHNSPAKAHGHGCLTPPIIPVSTQQIPCFPLRFMRSGKFEYRRDGFGLHCVGPDGDHKFPTQFPQVNDGISKDSASNLSNNFLSVLCPLLKLFSGGDPSKDRNFFWEEATSSLSTMARLPWGSRSILDNQDISVVDPPMRLQLFEFEACPFCRRVREAITELDLSVEIYPCPKGSTRHREMVRRLGGREQFPFLLDPNTGISMYESGEIVKYLFEKYGKGRSPTIWLLESTLFTGWMPTILRAGRGMTLWEKAMMEAPPKKLELFSYENNPISWEERCNKNVIPYPSHWNDSISFVIYMVPVEPRSKRIPDFSAP